MPVLVESAPRLPAERGPNPTENRPRTGLRTRIKICGVTDPDLAGVAVAAGADALGLIFHPPSARHLELAQAAAICRAVGPFVATVAVLVNPAQEAVRAIIEQVNPSHLQFHGDEPAAFCAAFGKPYIKGLRVAPGVDLRDMEAQYPSARGILLDTHRPGVYGGSGAAFDWNQANYGARLPLILAGGLTADNVARAIAETAPFAVDVSSGVESDGRKDAEKIRRFCRAVGNAAA